MSGARSDVPLSPVSDSGTRDRRSEDRDGHWDSRGTLVPEGPFLQASAMERSGTPAGTNAGHLCPATPSRTLERRDNEGCGLTRAPKLKDVLPASLPPRGLNRGEAAAYVGVSPTLFDEMVGDGRMPKPKRINSRTVWDRHQLDKAFEALPDDRGRESGSFAV